MQITSTVLATAILCSLPAIGACADTPQPPRTLKICISANAPDPIRQAAESVLAAVSQQPLLRVFAGDAPPTTLTDTEALRTEKSPERAYSHLVVIGLRSDPMIQDIWQREALIEDGGIYVFGFGHLSGDIGYIESGRNPYLHSSLVGVAPYETEVVTITGTSASGVVLAVNAFLHQDIINGVIAGDGWKRGESTLLDHNPLSPGVGAPSFIPATAGDATLVGFTEASQEEYMGVLSDAKVSPTVIWRAKYYVPGAWDGAGDKNALIDYSNGLHRFAYGNTLWCAQFPSTATATTAAGRIAAAAHLKTDKAGQWKGAPAPLQHGTEFSNPLILWQRESWVFMSTLPELDTEFIKHSLLHISPV